MIRTKPRNKVATLCNKKNEEFIKEFFKWLQIFE